MCKYNDFEEINGSLFIFYGRLRKWTLWFDKTINKSVQSYSLNKCYCDRPILLDKLSMQDHLSNNLETY